MHTHFSRLVVLFETVEIKFNSFFASLIFLQNSICSIEFELPNRLPLKRINRDIRLFGTLNSIVNIKKIERVGKIEGKQMREGI